MKDLLRLLVSLGNISDSFMIVVDQDHKIVWGNKYAIQNAKKFGDKIKSLKGINAQKLSAEYFDKKLASESFKAKKIMRKRFPNGKELVFQPLIKDGEVQGMLVICKAAGETDREKTDDELTKLKLGIDRSDSAIFITDIEGKITYMNPAFEKVYGFSQKESLGKTPRIIKSGVIKKKQYKEFWKALLSKHVVSGEMINKRKDGTLVNIHSSNNPIIDINGRLIGFLGIHREITEEKKAQIMLSESEEKYRSLFNNMLNGFAYCKMLFKGKKPVDFIYLDINNAFEKLTGLKDVIGKKVSEVIPGILKSDPGIIEIYGRVALTGKPEKFERFVSAMDLWFSVSVYSPKKEHFVALFDVITERKKAEEKLKKSEERISNILDNLNIGVAVNRVIDGKAIYFNKKFLEIYGWPKEDLTDVDTFFERVYPNKRYREDIKTKVLADIGSGDISRMRWDNLRITTKKGENKIICAYDIPLLKEGLMISTVQDVTEKKNYEEDKEKLENELRDRVNELERFQKLTIDRELKMIELKSKIKELEEKTDKEEVKK